MNQNKNKNRSTIFLVIGIVFLSIGIATDNTTFSWAAVAFIFISLILGGRWMRPRNRINNSRSKDK